MPPIGKHRSAANTSGVLKGSLTASGNVPGWSASQNQVGAQLMAIYTGAGMSKAGASGMLGNQMQESSLDPNAPGGGLSQWIGARAGSLRSYAASISKPANSVEAQGNFAVTELKQGYPQLWSYLTTASDPKAAALAISQQYERPAAWAANNANRQAQAQAAFDGVSGAPQAAAPTGGNSGTGGPGGSGFSPLDALMSFVSGDFQTLAGQMAGLAVTMIKDTAIGIGDLVVVPFWHWNQRATQAYWLNMTSPKASVWMLPGTAVFWSFGYWLLWKDPDAKGFTPAPAERARLARHVRDAQSVPARRGLVKPKDVVKRTIKKPKPVVSRAVITQTGTMRATRTERVNISGQHESISRERVERAGNVPANGEGTESRKAQGGTEAARRIRASLADEKHRAGSVPLPRRGGPSNAHPTAGRGQGDRPGHG